MLRQASLLVLLISIVVCLPPTAARAGERGVESVDALLTLRFDPDGQSVLWPEVRALLEGSPREAWEGQTPTWLLEAPDTYRSIVVDREEADEAGALCVRVKLRIVGGPEGQIRADRLLQALVTRVSTHVLRRAAEDVAARRAEAQHLESLIQARTKTIASGRVEGALPWPLSAAAFYENKLERRADVRREITDLQLDAATLHARREALESQYEDLMQREAAAASKSGNTERAWAAILDTRERFVVEMRTRLENAVGSPLDVALAEEELAQARIERAAAIRRASAPSPQRQDLESALLGLRVDAAALVATSQHLTDLGARLSAELEAGKSDVLRISRIEDETQILRERLMGIRERTAAWRAPSVGVIRLD